MKFSKKILTAAVCAACVAAPAAWAQTGKISDGVVKIGVMNDLSGVYADLAGPGSVLAAKMAVEDFGGKVLGAPIEIIFGDNQNKPDVSSTMARRWLDQEKVDAIADITGSAATLAVVKIVKDKNRITLVSAGATTRLTNEDCTDRTVHWTYDSYAMANGAARVLTEMGGDTWFFITMDYAAGHALEKDATDAIKAAGGKVVGAVRHPFPGSDFSSYLLQAQASGAKVIGLANAGSDMATTIKQAAEFGISPKQRLAATIMMITDIHSMGLKATQGMVFVDGFYWDLNDETRAWSKRFFERHKRMPTMIQAGMYSAVMHYLKAIKAAGTDDAGAVMSKMKAMPVNDFFAKNGKIRVDGRMVHDMYLVQVKKPEESKQPWDYLKLLKVIPGEQAFLPLSQSTCPLVKKK
ncbi:MAG: ABC transporter substrate-binding protein [Betaproteobacteria bacterium]|nr:MAG: ABC transporter substrate-binding protein [Betaproteobacteria bacterium]